MSDTTIDLLEKERDALAAQVAALREALLDAVDRGPPCPCCDAEDEQTESDGLYPHLENCIASAALDNTEQAAREHDERVRAEAYAVAKAQYVQHLGLLSPDDTETLDVMFRRIRAEERERALEEAAEEVAAYPGGDFREMAAHIRALGSKKS